MNLTIAHLQQQSRVAELYAQYWMAQAVTENTTDGVERRAAFQKALAHIDIVKRVSDKIGELKDAEIKNAKQNQQ
jgi:hypothetical protein